MRKTQPNKPLQTYCKGCGVYWCVKVHKRLRAGFSRCLHLVFILSSVLSLPHVPLLLYPLFFYLFPLPDFSLLIHWPCRRKIEILSPFCVQHVCVFACWVECGWWNAIYGPWCYKRSVCLCVLNHFALIVRFWIVMPQYYFFQAMSLGTRLYRH